MRREEGSMKKWLPLLLAIFLFCGIALQAEMRRESYERKDLRSGVMHLTGEEEAYTGILVGYFNKDQGMKCTMTYIEGLLHGERILYYKNGMIKSRETYAEGRKNGPTYHYYDTGQLMSKINYVAGKKNGEKIHYQKNGDIKSRTTYKNGKKVLVSIKSDPAEATDKEVVAR